ncbi:hypothetical protein [Nitrosomonas communis]|uniref:hypothetical protein n=1 Tax=Nitrosomonas communis TaxID=44574 RepID=UPI00147A699F|nr:hypothetical protein [Nitrosomonas communis]
MQHMRCQKLRRKFNAKQSVRIGDWESDSMIGKHRQAVGISLAERKSRHIQVG